MIYVGVANSSNKIILTDKIKKRDDQLGNSHLVFQYIIKIS